MPVKLPAPSVKKLRRKLLPWQCRWGLWYANEDRPSKELQAKVATTLANEGRDSAFAPVVITYDQVRTLKERPDLQEFIRAYREDGIQAARALVVNDLPLYADLHRWAALTAKERGDYRAVPLMTTPMLKAALPEQAVQPRLNVIISLSPARARLLDDDLPEASYEVLPPAPPEQ